MSQLANRFNSINSVQRALRLQKAQLLRDLRRLILELPENPDIEVLSKKPLCFVMPFSCLNSRDWTPGYYNFAKQYRAICREVRRKPFEKVLPFLRETLRTGTLKKLELYFDGTSSKRAVNIHPKVVENIQSIL